MSNMDNLEVIGHTFEDFVANLIVAVEDGYKINKDFTPSVFGPAYIAIMEKESKKPAGRPRNNP